jgi:SAM-dependent methyltransferase/uncharacterized protein YbaR (Trm112 family)
MKLSEGLQQKLICPATKKKLRLEGNYLVNISNKKIRYPIIDGIPVLINDDKSIFSIEDFIRRNDTTYNLEENGLKKLIWKLTPTIDLNIKGHENYKNITSLLPVNSKVLVIGGSIKGEGMDPLYSDKSFEIVGTDVSFGPYTKLVCDAHDIPFEDDVFDCVIIQAVLEHVLDPHRCVSEIHRILKPAGIVYAETPFMQQAHMTPYDFTRFTYLGHRRLFRHFEELDSGPVCGPGMALAWSYTYFLKSFSTSHTINRLLTIFARYTSFILKYFDYYLINKPGAYDAASGLFFMGRKSSHILTDSDLIKQFKGLA